MHRFGILLILFLLAPDPSDETVIGYKVMVHTGDIRSAGTNAYVYIQLFGKHGDSGERELDDENNNFERGMEEEFNLESSNLGILQQLRIRHDNSGSGPGWFLDKIKVEDMENHRVYYFLAKRWLATDAHDGAISINLKSAEIILKNPGWYPLKETLWASVFFTSEEESCFDVTTIMQHVPMAVFELLLDPYPKEGFKVEIKALFPGEALQVFTKPSIQPGNGDYTSLLNECLLIKGSDFIFECQCSSACLVDIHLMKNNGAKLKNIFQMDICGIYLH